MGWAMSTGVLAELRELPVAVHNDVLLYTDLCTFFTHSDEQDQAQRLFLGRALADAQIQNRSRKIRDKLINLPQYTVEATLEAMDTVGDSLAAFKDEVKHSAQYALNQTWHKICERLKLEGHRGSVRSVAFSPQGDRIVSGSADNTLRLWDREGNPIGQPLEGHRDSVWSVAFSPQGDRIVSGSSDNTLRLWDRIRWQDWLHDCCNQLLHHSDLVRPKTDAARGACQVCMDQAWTRRERAEFLVAQGKALAYYEQDADGAVAKFDEALSLDGTALEVEPRELAEQIKGWGTSP
ncbi:hypothetical protein IXB50_00215 [Leptothoe spongobia TAU-MAC 1115]|uniref:Uncharacterized protein n=2 Tax=Leptothoe TaxID=2651725 RepID=A0A947DCA8_9CYAN|nr:hypothetical protein [Leptothoe spongobia TAU-MAC 1115]